MLALGCCESWRRGGGSAGRVPSLMTAAVESEASESSFFSLSLARRPRGFRLERELNEVSINLSLTLDNFVGRQGEEAYRFQFAIDH